VNRDRKVSYPIANECLSREPTVRSHGPCKTKTGKLQFVYRTHSNGDFGMSPAVSSKHHGLFFNNTEHNYSSCGFKIAELALVQSHLTSSRPQHVTAGCRKAYELVVFPSGLTLRLLMSYIYIYGAPSKARNANVVYIWTYVWQR